MKTQRTFIVTGGRDYKPGTELNLHYFQLKRVMDHPKHGATIVIDRTHIYVKGDAAEIQSWVNKYIDDGGNPLLMHKPFSTNAMHQIIKEGSTAKFALCFNPTDNNGFALTLPEGVEFVGMEFTDRVHIANPPTIRQIGGRTINVSGGFTYAQAFVGTYGVVENDVIITIQPNEGVYDKAIEQRLLTTINMKPKLERYHVGYIDLKFTKSGYYNIPGVAGGHFVVE